MQTDPPVVLVVEDDALVADMLRAMLEHAGYTVEIAATGAAGLARIAAGGVDLVLLDMLLPEMNGIEVCERLRAEESDVYLPIIILTAQSRPEQRQAGFAAGADDFLTKPFDREDLLARVQVWVRARQRMQALYSRLLREQEQVRRAQRLEALGRLAGGVAHDFNNLLAVITGFSELVLQRLGSTDPPRSYLEEITKAGERATALTRQLLAFSRRQLLEAEVLDLNSVVADAEPLLRRVIGDAVELRTHLSPGLWPVKADRGQLDQVLLNLAVNARDAMPQGGCLTFETANVDLDARYARTHAPLHPGQYVQLTATDTGIGMTPEVQAQIFEPFFTTKRPGKGTGLGLATVYGIVKQSGGYIWVYSEPGHGTTFKIYLPREVATALADRAPSAPPYAAPGGTETVLVVEDNPQIGSLVRGALAASGYTVLAARHGEDALRLAVQHTGPLHLLLTDAVLPGLHGRELARRLATHHPGLKVLFMSGYTDQVVVEQGLIEPGAPFLQKPFSPDALRRKVREVLALPRG
ncbi:MAG TPA: response regulator [Chloroflexota bacterium]|nr:response regulator [Chloroflexota bacterium]